MRGMELALPAAAVLAVAIAALARAHAPVTDAALEAWAGAHALRLTAENRDLVRRHLHSARILRTWCGVAGVVLPVLVELAWHGRLTLLGFGSDGEHDPGAIGWIFVGYLAGALLAELRLARPTSGSRRAAALVPRELSDYLPRRVLWAQRGLAAVAALGLVAVALVPYGGRATAPDDAALLTGACLVVGLVIALEWLERRLVGRPQPFAGASLLAADDAIRAQAVHSVAGAALALLLLLTSGIALGLTQSDVDALRLTMWFPAAVAFGLALRACGDVGHRAWRVRRGREPGATPA
jgi:hypothetical protein